MINEILAVTPGKIELTEWFETKLKKLIQSEKYSNHQKLERTLSVIVRQLAEYKADNFIEDVVIGMSGGIDSSYLVYVVKEILGLRPLVFHVDGGWNSQIAVNNIEKIQQDQNLHQLNLLQVLKQLSIRSHPVQ